MSETRFTPGPWIAVVGDEDDSWGVTEIDAAGSHSIAQMVWQRDAYLISATPDLYKALSEASEIFRSYEEIHRAKPDHAKADANAAFADHYERILSKARGEK